MTKCDGCGRRSETGLGERCGVRLSGEEWCSGTVREEEVGPRLRDTVDPEALSKVVGVGDLRALGAGSLAAFVIGTAGALGVRFAWGALGAILLRATDEELAALFRPTRGGR